MATEEQQHYCREVVTRKAQVIVSKTFTRQTRMHAKDNGRQFVRRLLSVRDVTELRDLVVQKSSEYYNLSWKMTITGL
ncbi:unnamed protein product [Angiostrongylus costaricensis]|uniref:Cullin domain-containing protein n=1 Tax=Angiostrongylus costaricensis TaxID=334426 RepID=A0A0R3PGA1_ANGCS|nr:unnamed protein product [Angiostrongylus costaricensis]